MKKIIVFSVLIFFMIYFCPVVIVSAASERLDRLREQVDYELSRDLDDSTAEDISELGISPSEPVGIETIDMRQFFRWLLDRFLSSLKAPVMMLGRIIAVTILYSAVSFLGSENSDIENTYGTVCVIVVIAVMVDAFSPSLDMLKDSLSCINRFMITYIPVFSAVSTAGGNPASAGVYTSSTLFLCEVAEYIASVVLMPFLSSLTAMAVVSAIDTRIKISGAAETVRRFTVWLLAAVMIVFVGLLTIQGVTCAAADSVAARTIRFTASNFIPVIGSSVSDAYLAVKSGVGVIRSAVGGFGMAVVFVIALRPFLMILSMRVTLWAGRIANELLGLKRTAELYRTLDSVLSVGVSILIAITSSFLVATAAVMSFMTMG